MTGTERNKYCEKKIILAVFYQKVNIDAGLLKRFVSLVTVSIEAAYTKFDTHEALPPFSLLRDFSLHTSEHFAIRFRQSYLIWEVCDVTAIELGTKE